METLPAPLVPAEVDLSDFGFMPLDVARFRDSGLAAEVDPAAGFYAVLLWSAAWHQSPAGSLPSTDQALAKLAGFGRDLPGWQDMREHGSLRGFVLCSDHRLYHPVICEKALEAWIEKLHGRLRGGFGNAKRWKTEFDPSELRTMLERAQAFQKALRARPKGPPVEAPKVAPPPAPVPVKKAARKSTRPPVGKEQYSELFEAFWDAYPASRRSKKLEAWTSWQRDGMEEFAATIIRDVTERQTKHWGWVKEGGKYIPGAQVYLNGRRWNDAIEPIRADGRRSAIEDANNETAGRWADGDPQ